jgi:hypothetical protein
MEVMIRKLAFLLFMPAAAMMLGCPPKVDCDKLKKKTHDCAEEILWALKKKAKENFDKNDERAKVEEEMAEAVKKLRASIDEKIYEPCKKHGGKARDAKEMKACLKKQDCKELAACFVQFLKEKKEK